MRKEQLLQPLTVVERRLVLAAAVKLTVVAGENLTDALDRGYEDVAAGRVIELKTEDQIDGLFASL